MKYNLLFLLLFVCSFGQAQDKNQFSIKGKISGQSKGWIYLSYPGIDGKMVKDSAQISDGKFSFKGKISHPVMASINASTRSRSMDDPNFTMFFMEPGKMEITVAKDGFKDIAIKGSPTQSDYAGLQKAKKKVEEKYRLQLDSLRTERDHEKNAEIRERLAPYFSEMDQQDFIFFSKHPQSYVTAYMLRFHTSDLSLDALQGIYNKLGPALQQTTYGKEIAAEIIKIRWGSPGSIAKDFSATEINGNPLSLSSYKGKYVLLDFWASWCVPCRKGNPHLKELYAKYKDKGMEIIGIADDDRAEDAWKKAVEKDGIGIWKHVRRGLKYENGVFDRSTDISEKFGIHTLPTKILIDPKGRIIGRYGEVEAPLDRKLKEVFGY